MTSEEVCPFITLFRNNIAIFVLLEFHRKFIVFISSVSSCLSGASANTWDDILKWKLSNVSDYKASLINKALGMHNSEPGQ